VQEWREHDGTILAYGYTGGHYCWMHLPGLASYRFDRRNDEVLAISEPFAREWAVRDTFHRSIVPLVLQTRGGEVLHASGVLIRDEVAALCASAESGKSTIAYGLGRRVYEIWADDAIPFTVEDDVVRAFRLPFLIRLRPASADHFAVRSRGDGVTLVSVEDSPETCDSEPRPLAAIFLLERLSDPDFDEPVSVRALSPTAAFTAVLSHAYYFDVSNVDSKRSMMESYLGLVDKVPIFSLRYWTGLQYLDLVLDAVERSVSTRYSKPRSVTRGSEQNIPSFEDAK
jgi:hypothetical protein